MKTPMEEQSAATVTPEEVRRTLDRILRSKHFVNAHKKQKFLRLICDFYLEGRAQELNEHILGFDVFGRDSSYTPADDPIVRVFAHEIRKKLEAYYQAEGAEDPIRLEIPAGSYQPVFTRQAAEPESEPGEAPAPAEPEARPPARRLPAARLAVGLAIFCLAVAVIGLAVANWRLRHAAMADAAREIAAFGEVWSVFMKDPSPPLVILSNPPVLRFTNPSDPEALTREAIELPPEAVAALRDRFVTNPEVLIRESAEGPAAGEEKLVVERVQTPRLIFSTSVYTGVGEAIGLHYLTDFFRKAHRGILLKQSRTLSAEDLKKHNVIMLGGGWVNEWSGKLARSEDFVFTSKGTVENRNQQPGEEREYIPQFDRRTGNLLVDYALITLKPNISDANDVMLLAGVYSQGTEAAAEYVTNPTYLDHLNQRLRQSDGSPHYFQALLKVEVENGIPTTVSVLALHRLRLGSGE